MDRQNDVYFPPNFMQNFQNSPPAIPTPPAAPVGPASAFQPPQPSTSLSGLYDQDVGMEFANAFMQCAQGPGPSWAAHQPMHYPQHAGQMPPQAFYPPPQPNYPSMSVPPYQPQLPNQPPPMPFPHQYPIPFQGHNSAFAPPPSQYYHQQPFYGSPPGVFNFVQRQDIPGPSHTPSMAACGPLAPPMLASPPQTAPSGPPQLDHQQQTFVQPPAQDIFVDVKARMTPHEVPTDIPLSRSYDSPPQPSTSFALSALNVDNFTSDTWIASFSQFHSQQIGGSVEEFHRAWPEYAGVENTFTKNRDRYVKLKDDLNRLPEASDKEKEAMNAELFCAKIEFEKAIRRLDRFVQLVKSRPAELRGLLSRKTGFNEIFRQLSLPGEYASDRLLNDLFDWTEGQKRHSAYSDYYEKKLEADGAIRYRCLFEGCYFDYVSSADRKWESVKQKLRIHVLTHIPWKAKKIQSPGQRNNRRASSSSTASTPRAGTSTMVESKVMDVQPGIYGETSTQALYPMPPTAYEATIERMENAFAAVTEPAQQQAPSTTPLSSSNALSIPAKSAAAKTSVKPEPESSENYNELSALLAEADEFVEASTSAQVQEQTNEPERSNQNDGSVSPSKMTIRMRAVKSEEVASPTKAPEPEKGTESAGTSSAADESTTFEPKREPVENEIVEPEDESVPIPLAASPLPSNSQPITIDDELTTEQQEASSQPEDTDGGEKDAEPSQESNEAVVGNDDRATSPPPETADYQAEDGQDSEVLSYAEIDVVTDPPEDPAPSPTLIRGAKKAPNVERKRQLRSATSPLKRKSSRRVFIDSDSEDESLTTRRLRSQDTESVVSDESDGPPTTAKRMGRKRAQPEAGCRPIRAATRALRRTGRSVVYDCDATDESEEEHTGQPASKRQLRSCGTVDKPTMESPVSSTPTRLSGPRAGSSTRGGELVTDTETSPQRCRVIISESDESPVKGPPPQRRIGAPPSSMPAPASAPKKRAARQKKAEKSIWDTDVSGSSSESEYDPTHSDDEASSSKRRRSGRAKRQDFSARPARRQLTSAASPSTQPSTPTPAAAPHPETTNATTTVTPKPAQKTGNPLEGEGFYGQFFVHVPLDGGKSRYDCRFGKCSYTYLDTTNRRCALSSHFRSRHAEEYRAQLREKVNEKLEALEEPEPADESLAEDWTDYERLRNEYVGKHEDFKTMATRLQRQGTDEATLVSGLAELDERMKLLDRTRGRLQEFLRFVDENPSQLRSLVDRGSTFNAILVELRGADEVKDLLDPAEDVQDKDRHRIDYEAFFGKRDVEGATWHKCKIERCNYVFGSVSQPTYVLGRRFKEHFAEKHFPRARKEVDGEEKEEAVTYEYWEDWAQLRVLEAEVENLQQLLEEANQESGPPTAAKRKVIEQYEKAKEKVQTLDALIRHCPVHVHMLLQQELPAEEVIRRLSCRLPFIQHDDLRNRPVTRVAAKPIPRAQPTPVQRPTTSTPQPGPSRASAAPPRATPTPSTSSASTGSDTLEMPQVELEVRPLTSLMPIAYRQFFAVDGRGYCKCRFVDCDYTYSETGYKDADHNALQEHCLTEHLS